MTPTLEARNLTKRYGALTALDGLSLSVNAGEIVCLLGANGAGKTTTLNLFLGFTEPTSGEALVGGAAVAKDPRAARTRLGYVAEVVALYLSLTGSENIEFFHALSGAAPLEQDARDAILRRIAFPLDAIDELKALATR